MDVDTVFELKSLKPGFVVIVVDVEVLPRCDTWSLDEAIFKC